MKVICYQYKATIYEANKKAKVRYDTIYPENPFGLSGQFSQMLLQEKETNKSIGMIVFEPIALWTLTKIHYRISQNPTPQNVVIPESLN